jgi:ketosteroid isomerase-like protein
LILGQVGRLLFATARRDTRRVMSEEPTTPDSEELMRQMTAAVNRGDIDAYMSHFADDAVWETRFGSRLEGTMAIRSYWEEFTGSVEGYRVELLEFVDLGGGVTLWVGRQGGRPGGSSSELLEHLAFTTVFVDGLVEIFTTYSDTDDARAAAERLAEERG